MYLNPLGRFRRVGVLARFRHEAEMTLPSFTIIVPTYQRRELVSEVVEAVGKVIYAGQVELVVVVDGSTDDTAKALRDIECRWPVRILEQPNLGAASARNHGASRASGDLLLFLDDDMLCDPAILQKHAEAIASGADAVIGNIPLDPASPPGFLGRAVGQWADERAALLASGEPVNGFEVLTGNLAIRRSVFESLGGFDEDFTRRGTFGNEDLDLGWRLVARHRVRFEPQAIARQRYSVSPRQYMRQYEQCGRADLTFAAKHPSLADELMNLRGARRPLTRYLFKPLAAIRPAPSVVREAAIMLANFSATRLRPLDAFAAKLFYAAKDVVYWSSVRNARKAHAAQAVQVLCYHALSDLSSDPLLRDYGMAPAALEAQLDELAGRGVNFITPEHFNSFLKHGTVLPPSPALLTFDDCYEDLLPVARDVLAPRGIPALAFAVTGMASGTNEWDQKIGARTLRLLDAAGLLELATLHVEIGCHSRSHRDMRRLSASELRDETTGARQDIEAIGLPPPRFFAYPYGICNRRVKAAVRAAGFSAAFGLAPRRVQGSSDPLCLPRYEILASDTGQRLAAKLGCEAPAASLA